LYTYKVVKDLVPNDAHHLKALLAADRVDDHVAVDADKVLGVQDAVLVLAGRVDHLDGEVVVAVADHFAESVFDGRVVRVDKVAVDVLDCEGGFAWRGDVLEGLGLSREMCVATVVVFDRIDEWEKTYRQICCRQWPSCAVSAEEAWWTRGYWVCGGVVSRRGSNGSGSALVLVGVKFTVCGL